jgi:hypothetical protein
MSLSPEQQKSNRRIGLVLAGVVLLVFFGFILKMYLQAR